MAYKPIVLPACEAITEYAHRSADACGNNPPYRALLAVFGERDFLLGHTGEMVRSRKEQRELDEFIGCRLYEEGIFDLFDLMNPAIPGKNHQDGAVIFDPLGEVLGVGVRLEYEGIDDARTQRVQRDILRYKGRGNVGMRHTAALGMSTYPEVDLAVAVSQSAGSVIQLADGRVLDGLVWVPGMKRRVFVPRVDMAGATHEANDQRYRQHIVTEEDPLAGAAASVDETRLVVNG